MIFCDENKINLCEIVKIEEPTISREYVPLWHGNMWDVGTKWKGNHRLLHHLCLILEEVSLTDAVGMAYGDAMQSSV